MSKHSKPDVVEAVDELDTDAHTTVWQDADYVADTKRGVFSRLYSGTGAFNIVGNRKRWYIISGIMLLICVASMIFRGFTFGIDFEGGTEVSIPNRAPIEVSQVEQVMTDALGSPPEQVQVLGSGDTSSIGIRTEHLSQEQTNTVTEALASAFAPTISANDVSSSDVSSTWGHEITRKMIIALVVFLLIVFVYIMIRFDREMSIAAMATMFFDLAITAGVYSLVGWEVTPAMVIGLLTILGFSIYDTVVVFDKVEENTRSVLTTSRRTYAEQANLAVNQTLMRSINTTIISVVPIVSLMVIAVWMLGVGTLKDLALIQIVGIMVGTYSSIFLATPLLVALKARRKDIAAHTRKVLARRERSAA